MIIEIQEKVRIVTKKGSIYYRKKRALNKDKWLSGLYESKEHRCWKAMMNRCYNKNVSSYRNYGGRGIKVCERWMGEFINFYEDMGASPGKNFSLDRINVNGDYEPGNCKWSTTKEQARNKTTSLKITHNGVTKSTQEWAEDAGILRRVFYDRVRRGWTHEECMNTPVGVRRKKFINMNL